LSRAFAGFVAQCVFTGPLALRSKPTEIPRSLEPQLAQQEHLCAGRFTAAEVSVGYALILAQHLGLASRFTPGVQAYRERLQQREGHRRALQVQARAAVAQGVSTVPAPDIEA